MLCQFRFPSLPPDYIVGGEDCISQEQNVDVGACKSVRSFGFPFPPYRTVGAEYLISQETKRRYGFMYVFTLLCSPNPRGK